MANYALIFIKEILDMPSLLISTDYGYSADILKIASRIFLIMLSLLYYNSKLDTDARFNN